MGPRLITVLVVVAVVVIVTPLRALGRADDEPEYVVEVVQVESRVDVDEPFEITIRLWERADLAAPYTGPRPWPVLELVLPAGDVPPVIPTFAGDSSQYVAAVQLPVAGDWLLLAYPEVEDRSLVPSAFPTEYDIRVVHPPPGVMTAVITGILITGFAAVLWMTRRKRPGPPPPPNPQTDSWWHSP